MTQVQFTKAATKGLSKMPAAESEALRRKIRTYADEPFGLHGWASPLQGRPGVRIRAGAFRAIVELRNGKVAVLAVLDAGPRGDIYRRYGR
jgi:mRNA-degrading endonuclease RelE of RelBE toxin-antitoxin system